MQTFYMYRLQQKCSLLIAIPYAILAIISGSLPAASQPIVFQKEAKLAQSASDNLIPALLDENSETRERAFNNLRGLGADVAVPALIQALRDKDWQVQAVAAYTLGRFGSEAKSAIPALSKAIKAENADVRFVVAQVLGEIGSEAVVPALIAALQDEDENVRVNAAESLKKLGPAAEAAVPELTRALWDGNWYVRNRSAEAISQLGWDAIDLPTLLEPWTVDNAPWKYWNGFEGGPPSSGAILSLMLAIQPSTSNDLEKIPDFLIKSLQDEDPNVRQSAIVALNNFNGTSIGYLKQNEAINGLIGLLKDKDSNVSQNALKTLGSYKSYLIFINQFDEYNKDSIALLNIVVSALIKALKDENPSVRQGAAQSLDLYDLPPKEASAIVSALIEALKDENPNVRQSAAQSLDLPYDFPPKEASAVISALIEALKDENPNVRQSAAQSLDLPYDFPPKEASAVISALIEALKDENPNVRQSAASSLGSGNGILTSALSKIIQQKNVDNEIRRSAAGLISRQYDEINSTNLQILTKALQDQDIGVRQNAAIALWKNKQLNTQNALNILDEGLFSEDPLIQLDAVFGLATIGTEAKPVVSSLIPFLQEDIEPLRYGAALAITDIAPKKECVPVLREILDKETDYTLRGHASGALQDINSQEAFSVEIESWQFEDREKRYVTTCVHDTYIPDVFLKSSESYLLLLQALENENIRSSVVDSMTPYSYSSSSEEEQMLITSNLVNIVIPGLIEALESRYEGNFALKEIFELKDRDIRRSAIYALGEIANSSTKETNIIIIKDKEEKQKIISALTVVVQNQEEDIDLRWMAATSLQKLGINQDSFFSEHGLINPLTVKCSFPYSQLAHVVGLEFNRYSAHCYHRDESGCGAGLGEIYSELRRRLSTRNSSK